MVQWSVQAILLSQQEDDIIDLGRRVSVVHGLLYCGGDVSPWITPNYLDGIEL
jgi:hypothetical protein